jgi:hypothetical protein
MRTRIAAALIAGLAVAGALGTAGVAGAKHGSDDWINGHSHHGQGSDDGPGHHRHGHGSDDGPNHH